MPEQVFFIVLCEVFTVNLKNLTELRLGSTGSDFDDDLQHQVFEVVSPSKDLVKLISGRCLVDLSDWFPHQVVTRVFLIVVEHAVLKYLDSSFQLRVLLKHFVEFLLRFDINEAVLFAPNVDCHAVFHQKRPEVYN